MLALTPRGQEWELHLNLLRHGRRTCDARRPACDACALAGMCPSAGTFEPAADADSVRRSGAGERASLDVHRWTCDRSEPEQRRDLVGRRDTSAAAPASRSSCSLPAPQSTPIVGIPCSRAPLTS